MNELATEGNNTAINGHHPKLDMLMGLLQEGKKAAIYGDHPKLDISIV